MNDRRREPKGIPAGGEFAKEAGAVPNADDLDRNDARLELPGCLAVGEGWTLAPFSTGANNQYRFTDDEGGMLETQDDDWFDPNLGDCSSRSAKYVSPRGDKVVAYDMKVETEGRADISAYTPDGLKRAVSRAKRALGERTGIEPERVEVKLGPKPGAPMRVRADYPHAGAAGWVPSVQGADGAPREPPSQEDGKRLGRGRTIGTGTLSGDMNAINGYFGGLGL